MKTTLNLLLLFLSSLWLAGCSTPSSRIKKNPELFATFPPEVQKKISKGEIETGFSTDMAAMALGRPDRTYTRTSEGGTTEVWAYVDYRSSYTQQMVRGSYQYRDSAGRMRTGHDNVWVDVESRTEYDKTRVEFRDGKVIAIERTDN